MVSIRDVADHAGVAISTVSKVLNHYPNVSEATKQKVNKAVEELKFVPNSVAAALSSKQAGRVALLINLHKETQAVDEIGMQYISGALDKAMELNLDVITLFFFMFRDKTVEELIRLVMRTGEMALAIRYLKSQSITGIIIYGVSKDDTVISQLLERQEFKCVVVDAPFVNENTSFITIDHRRAQYEVAKKTIQENKCKSVLYLAGKRNSYVTDERLLGMQQLAKELSLPVLVKNGDFSELQARNLTLKYAKKKDAVVCASDLMAIGAMKALIKMDIFRPVCGFDGIILMGYVGKQMNTVSQNFSGLSRKAMEELSLLLSGEKGRKVICEHTLVRMKYEDIIC